MARIKYVSMLEYGDIGSSYGADRIVTWNSNLRDRFQVAKSQTQS